MNSLFEIKNLEVENDLQHDECFFILENFIGKYKFYGKRHNSFLFDYITTIHEDKFIDDIADLSKLTSIILFSGDIDWMLGFIPSDERQYIFIYDERSVADKSLLEAKFKDKKNATIILVDESFFTFYISSLSKISLAMVYNAGCNASLLDLKKDFNALILKKNQPIYKIRIKESLIGDSALDIKLNLLSFWRKRRTIVIVNFGIVHYLEDYYLKKDYTVHIVSPVFFMKNVDLIKKISNDIVFSDSVQDPRYLALTYYDIFAIVGQDNKARYLAIGSAMIFFGLCLNFEIYHNKHHIIPSRFIVNSMNKIKYNNGSIFSFFGLINASQDKHKNVRIFDSAMISNSLSIVMSFLACVRKNKTLICVLDFHHFVKNRADYICRQKNLF